MKAFFAAFLALLQFLFTSVGVLPYKTDVDYGGTPYVEPVARHLLTLIENGESPYSIVISQTRSLPKSRPPTSCGSTLRR